jgi:hypothetical protein
MHPMVQLDPKSMVKKKSNYKWEPYDLKIFGIPCFNFGVFETFAMNQGLFQWVAKELGGSI